MESCVSVRRKEIPVNSVCKVSKSGKIIWKGS